MNWIDFVVLGVIAGCSLIGYARGFVYSIFKVASFFISAFLSIQAYPYVSKFLISTFHMDQKLKGFFTENLTKIITPEQIAKSSGAEPVTNLISSWGLPKPVEAMVVSNMSVQTGQIKQNIVEMISSSLSVVAVNIICIIVIFAIVSFALIFARSLLQGIASLPIFKQINRGGGLVFGCLEGLIIIYVGFAILTLFSSSADLQNLFASVKSSLIAKQFYSNNLLLLWAFGAK